MIVVFVILVLLGTYYFLIKPSQVRKECDREATEESVKLYPPFEEPNTVWEPNTTKRAELQSLASEQSYQSCLRSRGFTK